MMRVSCSSPMDGRRLRRPMRLRNSGRKCRAGWRGRARCLRESFFTLGPGGGELRGAEVRGHDEKVFLKSTVRPLESVRRPSSRTWRRTLKTSRGLLDLVEENDGVGRRRTAR